MARNPSQKAVAKVNAMKKALEELRKPENMKRYGEMLRDMIKLRTKLGDGVKKVGDPKQRLKALKESTKRDRERLKEKGKLSQNTSPGKSNLTRSGDLLDSLKVKSVSTGKVTIGPSGTREDGLTNEAVAKYVSEQGREFNNASKIELKRLNTEVKKDLRRLIKSQLTKTK